MGWVRADYQKIFGNIRIYSLKHHNMHYDSQSLCKSMLCVADLDNFCFAPGILFLFKYISFQKGSASVHIFINKSLPCTVNKCVQIIEITIEPLVSHQW